jgi:hypothetical protein
MNLKECPACESAHYWRAPRGYVHVDNRPGLFKRCEVCKGHGVVTDQTIFHWELSL